jgi:hypothetical protein
VVPRNPNTPVKVLTIEAGQRKFNNARTFGMLDETLSTALMGAAFVERQHYLCNYKHVWIMRILKRHYGLNVLSDA